MRRVLYRVCWAAPFLLLAVMAWQHRWISDDGFINLRIATQWQAGRGPVFNPGERVEAGTSFLWPLLIALGDWLLPLPMEWVAVLLGFVCTALAMWLATRASLRLVRAHPGDGVLLPLGVMVFAVTPPVWDFVTSGLELPLTLLWLAGSWALLVAAYQGARASWWAPVVFSTAILVRPDLMVFAVVFIIAWCLLHGTSRRLLLRSALWFIATPFAITVFRAGFFGVLVPNTALTKEAGGAYWSMGWTYLIDGVAPYWLWLPVLLLGVASLPAVWAERAPRRIYLVAAPLLGALLHLLWLVRVGGDFMHGRMLLPALCALLLPGWVLRVGDSERLFAGLICVWAAASLVVLRPTPGLYTFEDIIANERNYYTGAAKMHNPVRLTDVLARGEKPDRDTQSDLWIYLGYRARELQEAGTPTVLTYATGYELVEFRPTDTQAWPTPLVPQVVVFGNIGMIGYAAGPDVYIADVFGVADPVVARLTPEKRDRPGHEKRLPHQTVVDRVALNWMPVAQDTQEQTQRKQLNELMSCPPLRELTTAISEPLSPQRFWGNILSSWRLTRLRIPVDMVTAAAKLCP